MCCVKKINIVVWIMLFIPILSVVLSVVLRLSQGEKTEEIVFGIFFGLAADAVVYLGYRFVKWLNN